jgi:outer membrane protein insertion porin family
VNAQSGTSGAFGGSGGGPLKKDPPPPPRLPVFGPKEQIPLLDVKLIGNQQVSEGQLRSMLQTRQGRIYNADQVEKDVRTLIGSGLFRDVKTFKKESPDGVVVTFQVFERPLIQHVRFVGNAKVKDKALLEAVALKTGGPLNRYSVEEGKRRLQNLYLERGFNDAQVTVIEGTDPSHRGVAYQINEGSVMRIQKTSFVGNTIATSARLKTQIDSKPGILYLMGGKLNRETLDQDVVRLTSYYRSLGFFGARVGREVEANEEQTWAQVKFVIDEGPRYRIRDIKFIGNERYEQEDLQRRLEIKKGEYYNVASLRRDLKTMRDLYGSHGYITSNIDVKPSFLEEPGQLDLVYQINEGQQFRVGRIIVNIDGEYAHTKRSVVLNRLSIKPGDIVDVRELKSSERRLQSSQLFLHDPAQGVSPEIVVKAPDPSEIKVASGSSTKIRGQSPRRTTYRPMVDVHVNGNWNPDAKLPAEPTQ